ncbi:MAG: efflux RND transporter periplasmic adaptor subunit [Gemmatimonadota bacterium]|nr:MAG: efflux RND transporter periplasmic adaptor subunit [Gemmatimonadota bacterium]
MTNRNRLLAMAGIIIGAVVVAQVMVMLRPEPPRRAPEPEAPVVSVEAVVAGSGPVPVFGSGTVRPQSEIDVAPEVGGRIVAVSPNLQSGGQVSLGEVLVRIDPADYENRVQQAQAEVATQTVALLQAEEEAKIAQTEYEQFRAREGRRGAGSRPPSPLALREPQLQAAKAALVRAEAQLREAQLALSRTAITSPFDGRVRNENADVGRVVAPGQSLGRIYASDVVEVVIPVSDGDAVLIPNLWALEAGDDDRSVAATVTTEYGNRSFSWEGYVDRAETALDEQSRTIDIVVRVNNPFSHGRPGEGDSEVGTAPPLLVGQFAQVAIAGIEPEEYFVVPRRALRPNNEVWAIGADGRVTIVAVDVLQESEGKIYVIGDLTDGQSVIVSGTNVATEGMVVRMSGAGGR